MESCGLTSWIFFIFMEKLYPPVSSNVPDCKPEAVRQGIAKRAKIKQKGRDDFSIMGKKKKNTA